MGLFSKIVEAQDIEAMRVAIEEVLLRLELRLEVGIEAGKLRATLSVHPQSESDAK